MANDKESMLGARRQTAELARLPVYKHLMRLWVITLCISFPALLWQPRWGMSLLWGFTVCLVPAIVFAWYARRINGASSVYASVNRLYGAEAAKFTLTAVLFAAVFTRDVDFSVPVFIGAYILAQVVQLVVTAKVLRHHRMSGKP
ncbi:MULTISPECIES: ATP synthase subunit I [unclassified Gilvimarinus]|uniref:ATP synthase subunit I n=1 Tax=unclassified Gilvimarinus TaxID=2642066 RepID=UPI0026E2C57F|nr:MULTISPECIES: ATP synthase subunit I [unclassified Gilvimarinus]MDO6569341.1 ATP synthase subunit I [Gilvimarinus sp. 2_MG-2023]MDO6747495.1 ATP synthase subunit I [Gilvimarinus sp. 1_MG-2023]